MILSKVLPSVPLRVIDKKLIFSMDAKLFAWNVYKFLILNELRPLTSRKEQRRDRLFTILKASLIWHAFTQAAVAENYRETYSAEAR